MIADTLIGQPPRLQNLHVFLKRLAHYACSHRDFCDYCPKIMVCFNHRIDSDGHPNNFSKGKCETTLRRHLLISTRTGKRQ